MEHSNDTTHEEWDYYRMYQFALGYKVWQLIRQDEKYVNHHTSLKIAAEILRDKK